MQIAKENVWAGGAAGARRGQAVRNVRRGATRGLIVCAGMPRGGSTLQYNLVRLLAERMGGGEAGGWFESFDAFAAAHPEPTRKRGHAAGPMVIKTHVFDPRFAGLVDSGSGGHVFYVYRDVRDAVVSYAEAFGESLVDNAARWARAWIAWGEQWSSLARATISRYEHLVCNVEEETRRYTSDLGVAASDEAIREIVEACSMGRLRERAGRVRTGFDEKFLVHPGHVRDGSWGRWRGEMGAQERRAVWHVAGPWLEAHGYPCYAASGDEGVIEAVARPCDLDSLPPGVPRMRGAADPMVRSFQESLRSPSGDAGSPAAGAGPCREARLFFGQAMTVRPGEVVSAELLSRGFFEEGATWALIRCLRPGDTFVDVGAHLGYFSLLAAHLVGAEGRVEAFEPTPDTAGRLRGNVAAWGRVAVHESALSDHTGEARFHDFGLANSAFNSLYGSRREDAGEAAQGRETMVRVTTLDEFCRRHSVAPDFIKIDAESAELEVLRGAQAVLAGHEPIISVEVGDVGVPGAARSAEVLEFVAGLGYAAYEYVPFGEFVPHRAREHYAYDNLLLLPPRRWRRRDGRSPLAADVEALLRAALRRQAETICGQRAAHRSLVSLTTERARRDAAMTAALHGAYVRAAWRELGRRHERVALLGAGRYARWLMSEVGCAGGGPVIVRALDDAGIEGDQIGSVPVVRPSAEALSGVDAIVVATDDPCSPLHARCRQVGSAAAVVNLYEGVVPGPYPKAGG